MPRGVRQGRVETGTGLRRSTAAADVDRMAGAAWPFRSRRRAGIGRSDQHCPVAFPHDLLWSAMWTPAKDWRVLPLSTSTSTSSAEWSGARRNPTTKSPEGLKVRRRKFRTALVPPRWTVLGRAASEASRRGAPVGVMLLACTPFVASDAGFTNREVNRTPRSSGGASGNTRDTSPGASGNSGTTQETADGSAVSRPAGMERRENTITGGDQSRVRTSRGRSSPVAWW